MAERNTPRVWVNGVPVGTSKNIDFVEGTGTTIVATYDPLLHYATIELTAGASGSFAIDTAGNVV